MQALKREIEGLKGGIIGPSSSSSSAFAPTNLSSDASKEELQAKLSTYQQFMAKYIVKAQEDKYKAVKEATEKAAAQSVALAKMETDYTKYKSFMEEYIVKSQEEKVRAIKAAEDAVRKQYGEQIVLASASTPAASPASPPATSKANPTVYDQRNAQVAAAAQANKSRWGDMETARVTGSAPTTSTQPPPTATTATETAAAPRNPPLDVYQQRNEAV